MARPHRPPAIWLAVIIASAVVVIGGAVAVVAGAIGSTDTASPESHGGAHGGATAAAQRPDPKPIRLGPQGAHPQFVVECDWSHSAPDDPIVLAGQPGNSHLHEFFGATGTNAFSTGESLLDGDTTCQNRADTAAYWVPALYDDTTRVQPNELVAYYRTGDGIDPATVEPWPVGLVMLAGDPGADQAQSLGVVGWTCGASDHLTVLPRQCSPRAPLVLRLTFPDCWDGTNLNSTDHRAHTAYSTDGACPAAQPIPIVQLVLVVRYDFAGDPANLRLASGSMITGHGDVMNGWSHDELTKLTNVCLRRGQICGISSNRTDV